VFGFAASVYVLTALVTASCQIISVVDLYIFYGNLQQYFVDTT